MNKLKININSLQNEDNINLHDAELKDIYCNYNEKVVNITFILHNFIQKNTPINIQFFKVKELDVSIYEPWGGGFYINELTIENNQEMNENLKFLFLLNSGDKIIIIAKEMLYQEI